MWAIVLLTAFLVSASATPIENYQDYIVYTLSTGNNIHGSPHTHIDDDSTTTSEVPTENNQGDPTENSGSSTDVSHDSHEHNSNDDVGHQPDSSVSSVSPTSAKPHNTEQDSNASKTNGDAPTMTSEIDPITNNQTVTEPPDGDPSDCKNASAQGHINLQCTFMCSGDEMIVAMNYTPCYMNQTQGTFGLSGTEVHSRTGETNIGVCIDGDCVPNSTTVTSTSSTTAATSNSPTDAPTSITPTDVAASTFNEPIQRDSMAMYNQVR